MYKLINNPLFTHIMEHMFQIYPKTWNKQYKSPLFLEYTYKDRGYYSMQVKEMESVSIEYKIRKGIEIKPWMILTVIVLILTLL